MSDLLTTESVPAADHFAYWREVICAVYVELDAEPVGRGGFDGEVDVTAWGDVRISRVVADGQVVTRRPADPKSDCLVSMQLAGHARINQNGRTALLGPGDFALYDATQPYELAFDEAFEQIVVQFPRSSLIARGVCLETAVATTCHGSSGPGALAGSFVRSLVDQSDSIDEDLRDRFGHQTLDLAATALAGLTGSQASIDAVRSFNRQRVLRHIDRTANDPTLSVANIAAHFRVSTRTLQKLFAGEELRVSERIRLTRVDRAKRALRDPLRGDHTIARIATDSGFDSPSHFARVFRAEAGCTPSDYRAPGSIPAKR